MNTIQSLCKLSCEFETLKTQTQTKTYWRGADIAITSEQDHPELDDRDTLILNPNAPEIIAALEPALKLLMQDERLGYDHQSKYSIIAELLYDLPDTSPGLTLIHRALRMVLNAHLSSEVTHRHPVPL
jgi:hypothetical protein